jgi:hypothetical protein
MSQAEQIILNIDKRMKEANREVMNKDKNFIYDSELWRY